MSDQDHADDILAALNASLDKGLAPRKAYELDDIKANRPKTDYVEMTLSRMFGGEVMADGTTATAGYRITTRAVAMRLDTVRELQRRVKAALEDQWLTVAGQDVFVQFETADPPDDDDGWWSALTAWTYVAT